MSISPLKVARSSTIIRLPVEQKTLVPISPLRQNQNDIYDFNQVQLQKQESDKNSETPGQGQIQDGSKQLSSKVAFKSQMSTQEQRPQQSRGQRNQILFGDMLLKGDSMNSICNIGRLHIVNSAIASCFSDIYSFYYIGVGILAFFTKQSPKSTLWFLITGFISIMTNLIFFYKSHNNVRKRFLLIDQTLVNVYEPQYKEFLSKKQNQLQKGDMILIQKGQIIPADCVLFANTGTESEVTFNEQPNDGNKQNVQLARLTNFNTKQISNCDGKLEYEGDILFRKGGTATMTFNYNNTQNESINQLNKQDVVLRGWQSVGDEEVLLIVVRAGLSCKNLKHGSNSIIQHAGLDRDFKIKNLKISGLLIAFSILISLLLASLQIIQRDSKYSGLKYLSGIDQTQHFMKAFMHVLNKFYAKFIIILSTIVPILQFPLFHFMLRISKMKIERCEELDPQIRGLKSTVNNDHILFNFSKTKFINVSSEALSREALTVSKAMVFRQVFDELQYEQKIELIELDERINEKEGFEQDEIMNAFEVGLLSLGFGVRNNMEVGLQNYILQLNMMHYTQTYRTPRLIQYPDENFKYYKPLLQINQSENAYQIIIYEIPFEKKQLEKIKKLNPQFKPEPSYLMVYKSTYEQAKQYLEQDIINQMDFQSDKMIIDNVYIISKKMMSMIDYKQLMTNLPLDILQKFQVIEDFIPEIMNIIHNKLQPQLTFEIQQVFAHSLVPLVDLSRAEIKSWIFSEIKEQLYLDYDATYGELNQYFHKFELLNISDPQQLSDTMDKIKQAVNIPFENKENPSKDTILLNNRKLIFVVDARTCDFALQSNQYRQQFKQMLLLPQFVYFLGCKQRLKKELIQIQDEFEIDSISVINNLSDVVLCQNKTYNIALSDQLSAFSDVVLPTFGSIPILLFNHCRLTHLRIIEYILYMTYTSVALTTVEVLYTYFNGFSADMFYASSLHFLYGLLFTSLYGASIHILKIDIQSKYFRKQSHLMEMVRTNHYFSWKRVLESVLWGVYHGVVCLYIPIYIFQGSNNDDGIVQGHYLTTMSSYVMLLILVIIKPIIDIEILQPLQLLIVVLNFVLIFVSLSELCSSVFASLYEPKLIYSFQAIFNITKVFWAVMFIPLGIMFPNFLFFLNFKVFGKHPHTKAMKRTQKELDEEYQRFQGRQARNIIRDEEEELLEKQSVNGITDEKHGEPVSAHQVKEQDI